MDDDEVVAVEGAPSSAAAERMRRYPSWDVNANGPLQCVTHHQGPLLCQKRFWHQHRLGRPHFSRFEQR